MKSVFIVLVLCITSCTSVRRYYVKFPKVIYSPGPSTAFAEASKYENLHPGIVSHVYGADGSILPYDNLVVAEKVPFDSLETGDIVVVDTPTDWTIRVLKDRYGSSWGLAGNPNVLETMTPRSYIGVVKACWTW